MKLISTIRRWNPPLFALPNICLTTFTSLVSAYLAPYSTCGLELMCLSESLRKEDTAAIPRIPLRDSASPRKRIPKLCRHARARVGAPG